MPPAGASMRSMRSMRCLYMTVQFRFGVYTFPHKTMQGTLRDLGTLTPLKTDYVFFLKILKKGPKYFSACMYVCMYVCLVFRSSMLRALVLNITCEHAISCKNMCGFFFFCVCVSVCVCDCLVYASSCVNVCACVRPAMS
jgi:hypothetical protein